MTEFILRSYGQEEFEVIIKTDNKEHYKQAEDFSRKLIDHAKPQTNADRIRAMSDEELAVFVRAVIMAEDCPVTGCDCDKCFFKEPCFNGSKWHGKETKWIKQPAG